jgi:hypothetical protein
LYHICLVQNSIVVFDFIDLCSAEFEVHPKIQDSLKPFLVWTLGECNERFMISLIDRDDPLEGRWIDKPVQIHIHNPNS